MATAVTAADRLGGGQPRGLIAIVALRFSKAEARALGGLLPGAQRQRQRRVAKTTAVEVVATAYIPSIQLTAFTSLASQCSGTARTLAMR